MTHCAILHRARYNNEWFAGQTQTKTLNIAVERFEEIWLSGFGREECA